MSKERKVWFHWQNLNERKDGSKGFGFWSGRAWLHLWSFVLNWEWHLWSKRFLFGMDFGGGEIEIGLNMCCPPVSLFMNLEVPYRSWLGQRLPAEPREIRLAIHDWAIWINPWSKQHEWCRADPWWVRGVTFHVDDFFLGKHKYETKEMRYPERVEIELDGRTYCGTAEFTRQIWKRPLWFAKQRDSTCINMDPQDGLPHSGKGENAWDCGDDALCGWGIEGFDVEKAIGHGIETVLKYRKRYGKPSCLKT